MPNKQGRGARDLRGTRFLAEDLWTAIEGMRDHDEPVRIAIAYLSCDTRFRLQSGDEVIVDASDQAIKAGQTSAAVLAAAGRAGAELFSHSRLHAKVIITSRRALVGSANLSQNSPGLVEAAIVSSDKAVRSAAEAWWERIRDDKGTVKVDPAFLERIRKIPVDRRGRGGNQKPTLADALEGNLPVLKDYLYGWHDDSAGLGRDRVAAEARRKGLLPRRIPSRSWTWYEWEYKPNLLAQIRRDCDRGQAGIEFEAVLDEDGAIARFKSVEKKTWSFIGVFRVKGRAQDAIIMAGLCQEASGIRLTGSHWRRELAERLTRGLVRRPDLKKRLRLRQTGNMELSELQALYSAGRI